MRKPPLPILRKLRALETQRSRLLQALRGPEPLLIGSLSLVNRTCGKPSCHCATKPGHPVWTLATTRDGQRRCQVVRIDDVEEIQQRVAAYKRFNQRLGELAAIEDDEKQLLRGVREKRNLTYE
jgi:hypothetical protein